MTQTLTASEARVLAHLDSTAMLAFLRELVQFQSFGNHESDAQRHIAHAMSDSGLEVDVWDIDFATLQHHPGFSWEIERATGLGVVGTLGHDNGGRSLIFNGHIDVVPEGRPRQLAPPSLACTNR